jgi:hypothetical protein
MFLEAELYIQCIWNLQVCMLHNRKIIKMVSWISFIIVPMLCNHATVLQQSCIIKPKICLFIIMAGLPPSQ